jgi:hypothetical protein
VENMAYIPEYLGNLWVQMVVCVRDNADFHG